MAATEDMRAGEPSSTAPPDSIGHQARETGVVERELWRRLKRDGDARARDALITRFLPLARRLAKRHQTTGVPLEDLVQVANVGLIAAVDRFDPGRDVAFSTYAVPVIRGELKRELDRSGWAVRTPRQLRQLMQRMRRSRESLTGRLGRAPSTAELADECSLSPAEVRQALEVELALLSHTEYLGRRAGGRGRDEVEKGVDDGYEQIDEASALARALATLSPQQRRALHLSFVEERPQHEIAAELDISQRQVSRILRGALERMQRVATKSAAT